jgi:hypothetical protein
MGFAGVHRRDRAQRIYGGANEIVKEIISPDQLTATKRALAAT